MLSGSGKHWLQITTINTSLASGIFEPLEYRDLLYRPIYFQEYYSCSSQFQYSCSSQNILHILHVYTVHGQLKVVNSLCSPSNLSLSFYFLLLFRNYFAFVVRDGARYQCYVFMENSVPAATIVTTIQRMLAPESSKKR